MKKALYIHGLNSDKHSVTGNKVKNILQVYDYLTVLKTFHVLTPIKTKIEIEELLSKEHFDLIIGHSLGGFYAFVLPFNKKILINPCLKPQDEAKKFKDVPRRLVTEFEKLEEETLLNKTEDVFGLFGTHDELFSYATLFKSYYGNCYKMLECGHKPDEESLKEGMSIALKSLKLV